MIGARTRGRELALQALFAWDVVGEDRHRVIAQTMADAEASDDVRSFGRLLADGVVTRREEVDQFIAEAADNWDFGRLAVVDRNILRLAVYEMLALDDVPPAVSIDQAIEMGKRFSTAQSGAFINGVLDRIREVIEARAEQAAPEGEG